ncbi:MAG: RHS repeat-associated core domain-containing protein [Gammaproteobacteria bacterium]
MRIPTFSFRNFSRLILFTALGLTIGLIDAAANPSAGKISAKTNKTASKAVLSKLKSDATVGALQGNFSVTPRGQAHYSIAIDVPPGTAKMQPVLSITYDSTSSNLHNGLLGMGFNLEGLTVITRCPSNKTQNDVIHGVDFSDQDRFCLNGEQLVAIKGAYGQDGTEYRTYNDTQARIISHGRQGQGPAYFTVEAKGGQIAEYGKTADSEVKAEGKDTVSFWALDRVKDTVGNFLDAHYFKDEGAGSFYPTEVDYTGNEKTGMAPYNAVKFNYESRPDVKTTYQAGSKSTMDKRLSEVQVLAEGSLVYKYKLNYEISKNTFRSRITSIQKCGGDGTCLPATTFAWQTNEEGWEDVTSQYAPIAIPEIVHDSRDEGMRFVDLNGNGLLSMLQGAVLSATDHRFGVFVNTGSGWQQTDSFHPNPFSDISNFLLAHGTDTGVNFVDLQGTGFDSMVVSGYLTDKDQRHYTFINTGKGFVLDQNYTAPVEIANQGKDEGVRFVHLTGSGLPDIIQGAVLNPSDQRFSAWINTGTGWQKADNFRPNPFSDIANYNLLYGTDTGVRFVDLRGTGLDDMVVSGYLTSQDQRHYTFINTGKGFVLDTDYTAPVEIAYQGKDEGVRFVHLTGSGLPDIIQGAVLNPSDQRFSAWVNTGAGWRKADNFRPNPFSDIANYNLQYGTDTGVRFVDLRGTGLDDMVVSGYLTNQDQRHYTFVNTGNSFVLDPNYTVSIEIANQGRDGGVRFVDLNGNGLPDMIQHAWFSATDIRISAYLNRAKKLPDYLISATDGLGNKLSIDYEPLSGTKVDVYTKEHNAAYPNMDWQGPMYVVYQTNSSNGVSDPKAIMRIKKAAQANGGDPKNSFNHVTTYHYIGAKLNHLGLGFLGFHQVNIKDESTQITKTITYGQDFTQHNIGRELSTETRLRNNALIHATTTQYATKTFGDGSANHSYYFTFVPEATENGYDLEGKLISVKTVKVNFDDYANALRITNTIYDPNSDITFTTVTKNSYRTVIDAGRWFPGELLRSEVTSGLPNGKDETHVASFTYDDATSLLASETTEPDDAHFTLTKTYTRDGFGNITKTEVTNADKSIDRITSNIFDSRGRFAIQSSNALGQISLQTFDPRFGVILSGTDLNGLTTKYTYDVFGRALGQLNPNQTAIQNQFSWVRNPPPDAAGAVYAETTQSTDRPDITQYYDALNRCVAKSTQGFDGRMIWETTQFDELDRVTRSSLPYFAGDKAFYILNDYDYLGRVIQTSKPDQSFLTFVYDGLTTQIFNSAMQKVTKTTDVRGNIISSVDNNGKAIRYKYDAFGRLLAMTDSLGNTTSMTYDKLGHKLSVYDPDKGNWKYEYNVLGELLKQTDANGNVTTFQYDALGRQTARTDGKGTSSWVYGNDLTQHNVGLLVREDGVANAAANSEAVIEAKKNGIQNYTKTISYDNYARPVVTTTNLNGTDYVTKVQYDHSGRVWRTTYPNGISIQNNYNILGYLFSMQNADGSQIYWQLNNMDASGRTLSETRSNGLVTMRLYDQASGFLQEIHTHKSMSVKVQEKLFGKSHTNQPAPRKISSNELQNLSYNYDALGNVLKRTDNANQINENFGYDKLNRLTNWNATGAVLQSKIYQYDELGNMTAQSGVGNYGYDSNAPHAVSKLTDGTGAVIGQFRYDHDGNQTYALLNGKTRAINYTSYEKPLLIASDTAQTQFFYDANREQFERIDQTQENGKTVTTTTLTLGNYEVENSDDGQNLITREKTYVGPYTEIITEKSGTNATTQIYEFLKDNLGSITAIVDEFANIHNNFAYEPFGKQIILKGTDSASITHQGFIGHQEVEPFNLIHMNGRIYDPILARFLSADPSVQMPTNLQSLNRYSYCVNNPLRYVDPNGFDFLGDLWDGVCKIGECIGRAVDSILENRYFQMAIGVLLMCVGIPPVSIAGLQISGAALAEGAYAAFNTALAGGGVGDILKSGALAFAGAEIGAFTKTKGLDDAAFGDPKWAAGVAVHGLEGGGMSVATGGNFADGFLCGAVMQAAQAPIAKLGAYDFRINGALVTTAATGIVGGTMAAATGGNFGDAFKTDAFTYLCARDFSITMKVYEGYTRLDECPGYTGPVARTLDMCSFGPLRLLPIYPFVHIAMCSSDADGIHLVGPEPKAGTGIKNFAGESSVYDDKARLSEYVVVNVAGFQKGFDAGRMQSAINQVSAQWSAPNAPWYVLPFNNCHDFGYEVIDRYAAGF